MTNETIARGTVLAALSLLVACTNRPAAGPQAPTAPLGHSRVQEPAAADPASAGLAPGSAPADPAPARGSVTFAVRWSERSAQAIPAGAVRIDFRGTMPSQPSLLATTSVLRPAATASLTDIPEGTMSISAKAYDASSVLVATGSTEVLVKANQRVPAKIVLGGGSGGGGSVNLVFTSFDPMNGFAGDPVAIVYSGTQAQPEVKFGTAVSNTYTFMGKFNAAVPAGAKSGKITLSVEGGTVTSTASFMVIGSVQIVPGWTGAVSRGASLPFSLVAVDPDGATFSSSVITCSCQDADGKNFSQRNQCDKTVVGTYKASTEAGRDRITCGKGAAAGELIVTVQ